MRDRFRGRIAGVGSESGVRVVVGRWDESPFGSFADVMVAQPDGTRVLLAPSQEVADFVAATYNFDRVEIGPVAVTGSVSWQVSAPGLKVEIDVGRRTALGALLRLVPPGLATAPAWSRVTDLVARRVLRGVRTRGTAGGGRVETYGATDLRAVDRIEGTWQGEPLGDLRPVTPEPRFGFGSTPERPGVTSLVTTVLGSTT